MKILIIKGHEVLLDNDDWLRLCHHNWQVRTNVNDYDCLYFYRRESKGKKRRTIYLHRCVVSPPDAAELTKKQESHHINGNNLDNRKVNLEIVLKDDHYRITHEQ